MSEREFDIVLYGASGFTGQYVLEEFYKSEFNGLRFAVAGRNEKKLRNVLKSVGANLGRDLSGTPLIVADSSRPEDLNAMAKRTRLIINVVGPYRLYGTEVVRAAVENGTHHVDISGEPAWLEKMQLEFGEKAKQNGCFVVGACGWDSIPADLGVAFLKDHFDGTLAYAETFVQIKRGEAGYVFNDGTYQTLILGLSGSASDGIGKIRRAIMPEKLEKSKYKPPKRPSVWHNEELGAFCLPFLGADKSVINRSQYYDATVNKKFPVTVETYYAATSWLWAWLGILWMMVFSKLIAYEPIRTFLQKYPSIGSVGMFSSEGPTREQCKQATFSYYFQGYGWEGERKEDEEPKKKVTVRCDGPDSGYIGTSGCILSSALTVLEDQLPGSGGVLTPAAAFKNTRILDRLASFGITFRSKMSEREFDVVIYGASGFTGAYILEEFVKNADGNLRFAVAGRSEEKLRKTLQKVSEFLDRDLAKTPIVIATTEKPETLNSLASRTRLIINAVGPFREHGEPVVRAAVKNGTHHLDISGEPAYQERIQAAFHDEAKKTGSCVVPGCGWDSIPCDLGVQFLRKNFDGVVSHAETFVKFENPDGYAINNGTYQTLLLSLAGRDKLRETRRVIMPEKLEKTKFRPPKRSPIWYADDFRSYVIPFPGADRSVVNRSEYYQATQNKNYPITVNTYILNSSWFQSFLIMLWFAALSVAVRVPFLFNFCRENPDLVSFGSFARNGPKREQVKKAKFTYYVQGHGWDREVNANEEPKKKLTVRCDGPDAGYIGTARCVLGAAFTILKDEQKLPGGGVFTPAIAFEKTNIVDQLAKLDVTFRVDPQH
ncbi:Epimerase [Aphelenchoides besseyi]|nr:Epimerase [Aphelenchoides besseyi]